MPVIVGGHRKIAAARYGMRPATGGRTLVDIYTGGGQRVKVNANTKQAIAMLDGDLALIQEHFGVSRSGAGRIALHLTAQAIRANKALPTV